VNETHKVKHFLRVSDLSEPEYRALFDRARQLKERRRRQIMDNTLAGRTLVLIFEKPSTRTRLSFEAAMLQLGGGAITLNVAETQLTRGETLADTARVVSRYADAVMFRTFGDERLEEFTSAATVPVINGLSDGGHPVQLLADLFTIEERLGDVAGKTVAFIGDGSSNMARSWIEAARHLHFKLRVAAPRAYRPPASELKGYSETVAFTDQTALAASDADVIATDVWTSMGQEAKAKKRRADLKAFRVDDNLLKHARSSCIVLHCLPAHRGEEISASVMDGPHSAIFDEAENRLHVQKALLEHLLLADRRLRVTLPEDVAPHPALSASLRRGARTR
jgi:ornithine carbamoyltransferase